MAYGNVKAALRSKVVPLQSALQGRRASGLHCSHAASTERDSTSTIHNTGAPSAMDDGRETNSARGRGCSRFGVGGAEGPPPAAQVRADDWGEWGGACNR